MTPLRLVTAVLALLLAVSEIARWWGDPRLVPLAFDELAVAATMLAAAMLAGRAGAPPLIAAWGLFTGLMLALLVPTLDHLLFGPEKASAGFYAVLLAAMLVAGIAGLVAALRLSRPVSREP